MHTPIRVLRALVDSLPGGRPILTPKQQDREAKILHVGEATMARVGRMKLTMTDFARALRMSPDTIRWHFVDLDCVLAEILLRHLGAISRAIGEIPPDAADVFAARRAAYLAVTRIFGAATPAHQLLVRERNALPRDLLQPVEQMRDMIAEMVGGPDGAVVLSFLDAEMFQAKHIEAMVAALEASRPDRPMADIRQMEAEPPANTPSATIRFLRPERGPITADQPTRLSLQPKREPPRNGPH